VAQPVRPKVAHAKGSKVTSLGQQFMGVVTDHHVSHRVRRPDVDFDIQVGDDELQPDDEVLESTISYLIERNWDGVEVWMTEDALAGGHLALHADVKKARS
jgi:hypothetical protein